MFSTRFVLSFALLLSLPLLSLLAPRILPPRSSPPIIALPDELDDLALFRRASLSATTNVLIRTSSAAAPGGGASSVGRPKIAFLFLTNSGLPLAPLWARFLRGHDPLFNAYIHASPPLPSPPPFRHVLVASKSTHRASPSLIAAARRLLAAALLDDPRNAFFALLSQSCVPLHSFPFLHHSLLTPPPPPSPQSRQPRFLSFIEILSDQPGLWDRYTARGDPASTMLPVVPFADFRVGSQFFILTRAHALLVVRDRRLWRRFRLPCKNTDSCYPEEHYFPTLLNMLDRPGCAGYTLTRVNWTGSTGGHPHTYGAADVSAGLVHRLRESNHSVPYLFARKFATACLQPLMAIADAVIFRD